MRAEIRGPIAAQRFPLGFRTFAQLALPAEWKNQEAGAQHNDWHLAVRPSAKTEDGFKCVTADDDHVDGGNEFVVAVGFTAALGQEIQPAIGTGDEAINAGADEN